MTENLYVQGYLGWWDELRRRHPDMLIDSCASGGRRNDLETLRRAVPLLRSDYQAPCINPKTPDIDLGNQGHTYGLAQWVPYYGTGVEYNDIYTFRGHLCPSTGIGWIGDRTDWAAFRRRAEEYTKLADLFYGDFYPLLPYNRDNSTWIAWQFHRPESGDGFVQVFRRSASQYESARLKLRGLEAAARYAFTDMDSGKTAEASGKDLLDPGLPVTIDQPRTAVILTYKKIAG